MGNKERLNAHGRRRLNDLVQLGMHRDLIQPRLNSVEEWRFINHNNDEHPIHVHVNDFQVIEYFDPTTGLRALAGPGRREAAGHHRRPKRYQATRAAITMPMTQRLQSSSASRFTAGAFGFLTFTQCT